MGDETEQRKRASEGEGWGEQWAPEAVAEHK